MTVNKTIAFDSDVLDPHRNTGSYWNNGTDNRVCSGLF